MEKITKREQFNKLLGLSQVANDASLVDFINHELALLDKRNASKSGKPTAKQLANEALADTVLSAIQGADLVDFGTKNVVALGVEGVTSAQKATAMLNILANKGAVTVTPGKKVNVYNLA